MLGPALLAGSDLKELGVVPNVLVILGRKKAPSRWKTQVRKDGRQQFGNMRDVVRLEEIGI